MNRARETNHTRDAVRRSTGGKTPIELGPWMALDHVDFLATEAIKQGDWELVAEALDYLRAFVRHHREAR